MNYLFAAALFPVVVLCYFIYKKDVNKEPRELLIKLFGFGCLTTIPILIVEIILGSIFPTDDVFDFFILFFNVFISVGLVEEGFKWLVVKEFGYHSNEFDEIYDIIVYSVFASLGFACVENVLYVFTNGFATAFVRALTAVPGHTSFGVIMGYFLSKAKINEINKNHGMYMRNVVLSLLVPTLVHTFYDAILFYNAVSESAIYIGVFYLFIIITYCICFVIVDRISKVQNNVSLNVKSGNITYEKGNVSMNTAQINQSVIPQPVTNGGESSVAAPVLEGPNFCPICGKPVKGANFCGFCGYKLK